MPRSCSRSRTCDRVRRSGTEWLYAIRSPRGAHLPEDATEEGAVVREHFAYVNGLFPGIVGFEAAGEGEARAFMEGIRPCARA